MTLLFVKSCRDRPSKYKQSWPAPRELQVALSSTNTNNTNSVLTEIHQLNDDELAA